MPASSPTGFVTSPSSLLHDMGAGHPESPARLAALLAHLTASGLLAELETLIPRAASAAELARAHDPEHVEDLRLACARGPAALDADTSVLPASWEAATHSAGGVIEALERVQSREWSNAFVATRPPGHHAEYGQAMGFCLFNNIAVGARHLLAEHRLERIAIVDFDVHHGNGTQHAFERDGRVFYASLHQAPLFPGTGLRSERGQGSGVGTTLNVPMAAGSGDLEWLAKMEGEVLPALEDFEPQFVLVSAGFDAHRLDPLAGCQLTEDGFRAMGAALAELAQSCAGGRLVSVLEGGYHLQALAQSAAAYIEALLGARTTP
jgi:acetoin utilization deacetylase AcuC-like enzyme